MEKKMQFKITGSQKILLRKLWESKKWAAVLSHFMFSLSLFFVCATFLFPCFLLFILCFLPRITSVVILRRWLILPTRSTLQNTLSAFNFSSGSCHAVNFHQVASVCHGPASGMLTLRTCPLFFTFVGTDFLGPNYTTFFSSHLVNFLLIWGQVFLVLYSLRIIDG